MSSPNRKIKDELRFHILRKRQRQRQQEHELKRKTQIVEKYELQKEICGVEKKICELHRMKYLLLDKFKQVLDEEVETARHRYEELSIRSKEPEDSTMKNGYVEERTITNAHMYK